MTNAPRPTSPSRYHLTFHTYGTWLPGDDRGWHHRGDGETPRPPSPGLHRWCAAQMDHPALQFTPRQRDVVRGAFLEHCAHRGFPVASIAVQAEHVHLVVTATVPPEALMTSLKGWATRALRRDGLPREQTVWATHGSTRRLVTHRRFDNAVHYDLDDHHREPRG